MKMLGGGIRHFLSSNSPNGFLLFCSVDILQTGLFLDPRHFFFPVKLGFQKEKGLLHIHRFRCHPQMPAIVFLVEGV